MSTYIWQDAILVATVTASFLKPNRWVARAINTSFIPENEAPCSSISSERSWWYEHRRLDAMVKGGRASFPVVTPHQCTSLNCSRLRPYRKPAKMATGKERLRRSDADILRLYVATEPRRDCWLRALSPTSFRRQRQQQGEAEARSQKILKPKRLLGYCVLGRLQRIKTTPRREPFEIELVCCKNTV